MSFIILPRAEVFFGLPPKDPRDIFAGARVIRSKDELRKAVAALRFAVASKTAFTRSFFSDEQLQDLDARPTIAVIADGATIHTNILNEEQRELQKADGDKAFDLGRRLALKGWRVALPGYNGLCHNLIEGIRAGGGQYIVAMTRQSLNYDINGVPLLPRNGQNGFYIITNTLAESKSALLALSDSLVYFRGGLRTLDIFTDHFVLEQTGMFRDYRIRDDRHRELILLNDDGFWQPVIDMTRHFIRQGFADIRNRRIIKTSASTESLIARLEGKFQHGGPWPAFSAVQTDIFIPSRAITLAAELSRDLILRQIVPVTPINLKSKLSAARKQTANLGPVDSLIEDTLLNRFFSLLPVYCGSRNGFNPTHVKNARAGGALLAELGLGIVYGGSVKGNMGGWADGILNADVSGPKPLVLAVTPFSILLGESKAANEGFHAGIAATIAVPGMLERKMFMTLLSGLTVKPAHPSNNGISIMGSGAMGSLDETFEEWSLSGLKVIDREHVILNIDRHWDDLPTLFRESVRRGYMRNGDLGKVRVANSIPELREILQGTPATRERFALHLAKPAISHMLE